MTERWAEVSPGVAWNGGDPVWHAEGHWIKYGPRLDKSCMTKLGARFGAWRRRHKAAEEEKRDNT